MDNDNASRDSFAAGLIRSLSAQLVADGLIDPTGLSKGEYEAAALAELKRLREDGFEFNFIVDHKDSVLKQARSFAQAAEADFAIMFYAMWIEHWLNGMYAWKSTRVSAREHDLPSQRRFRSMKDKMTSDWSSTFGEKLDASWVKTMLEIAEHRNAFVHYKWPIQDDSEDSLGSKDTKLELLGQAECVVVKLKAMEHQMVYGGFPHIIR
jgi:hypothetical protein